MQSFRSLARISKHRTALAYAARFLCIFFATDKLTFLRCVKRWRATPIPQRPEIVGSLAFLHLRPAPIERAAPWAVYLASYSAPFRYRQVLIGDGGSRQRGQPTKITLPFVISKRRPVTKKRLVLAIL
jgi:hypothetical protein